MHNSKSGILVGLILSFSIFFSACGESYLFEQSVPIENQTWTYADSLTFEVEISDTTQLYELIVKLDHSIYFSNQNMYTRISTQFPDGSRLSKPVSMELANNAGVWFGNCKSDWCTAEIPIQSNTFFNQTGTYRFTLEQFTRKDLLGGIREIGFAVKEMEE